MTDATPTHGLRSEVLRTVLSAALSFGGAAACNHDPERTDAPSSLVAEALQPAAENDAESAASTDAESATEEEAGGAEATSCPAPLPSSCRKRLKSTARASQGWIPAPTTCGVRFKVPLGAQVTAPPGEDSCLIRVVLDGCELYGDRGGFSDPLTDYTEQPSYAECSLRRRAYPKAKVITFGPNQDPQPFAAGIHVPSKTIAGASFTFMARCDAVEGQDTALTLFQTLSFED
jgi:hypothetical protein